jgi:hypothetical protein
MGALAGAVERVGAAPGVGGRDAVHVIGHREGGCFGAPLVVQRLEMDIDDPGLHFPPPVQGEFLNMKE